MYAGYIMEESVSVPALAYPWKYNVPYTYKCVKGKNCCQRYLSAPTYIYMALTGALYEFPTSYCIHQAREWLGCSHNDNNNYLCCRSIL